MITKIKEKIVEPTKLEVDSIFILKIKAIRGLTYDEIKNNYSYSELKDFKYGELKGD